MSEYQQIRRDANAFDQAYKDERYEQVKRDAEALFQQYQSVTERQAQIKTLLAQMPADGLAYVVQCIFREPSPLPAHVRLLLQCLQTQGDGYEGFGDEEEEG